ncbi:MAG: serine hydrolase [Pedobacter sp.]|nr:MAG: serine hydrolase [Pedobacter sp.]
MLLKEKITDQLGLKQTGQLDNITIVPSLSQGYHNTNGKLTLAPYRSYSLMKGSGDIYASAQDLAVFLKNLSGQRWKPEIISQLLTPHSKESIERGDLYGYGWFIREASSGHPKAYYHGGGSYGVSALMAIYPDEKLNIIILSNVSTLPVQELWGDIEKIALGQSLQMPEIRNELPIDPKAIEVVRGTYHASNGMQFTLSDDGGKLYAQLANNPPFEIFMQRPLHFYGKKVSIDLIFELDNNGKAKRVTANRTGDHFIFFKKQ